MGLYERWRRGWDLDRLAIRAPDGEHTYRSLHEAVRRATGLLRGHGVRAGDVVAIGLPKRLAFLELHLAALRLGAVTRQRTSAAAPGTVVAQRPAAGTLAASGTVVDIVVARSP